MTIGKEIRAKFFSLGFLRYMALIICTESGDRKDASKFTPYKIYQMHKQVAFSGMRLFNFSTIQGA